METVLYTSDIDGSIIELMSINKKQETSSKSTINHDYLILIIVLIIDLDYNWNTW